MTALSVVAWPAIEGTDRLLVVPLGSCEQHGPHLPFDVDTTVAQAACDRLVEVLPDAVLAPALAYGASGEHEGFAGTLSIGTGALTQTLVELGRSASRWASRVLFVSGHGGNFDALVAAVGRLRYEGRPAAWWPCGWRGGDAHAGRTETSLLLALRPEVVDTGAAAAGPVEPIAALLPRLRASGVRAVSRNGVLGDPCGATAAEGARLLDDLVAALHAAVAQWQVGSDGRLTAVAA